MSLLRDSAFPSPGNSVQKHSDPLRLLPNECGVVATHPDGKTLLCKLLISLHIAPTEASRQTGHTPAAQAGCVLGCRRLRRVAGETSSHEDFEPERASPTRHGTRRVTPPRVCISFPGKLCPKTRRSTMTYPYQVWSCRHGPRRQNPALQAFDFFAYCSDGGEQTDWAHSSSTSGVRVGMSSTPACGRRDEFTRGL